MTQAPAHKGLYDADQEIPALLGSQCAHCSTNFFPPLAVGCERCGHAELTPVTLAAAGKVHATATVHLHQGKDIKAPFTVAEIVLDDGPLIRALLTEVTDDDVIGIRAAGEWVCIKQNEDGQDVVEPRFRLVREGVQEGASA